MDTHRNVYMWGQQELIKKEMMASKMLTAQKSASMTGKY